MPDQNQAEPFASPYVPKPDSLRDTIESVVIAFIFAFVFRAFVVEAFVIPTGSMAPTLYGLHGQHRCAACQYPFAYGIREDTRPEDALPLNLPCPNCGWNGDGNSSENAVSQTNADSGDRILVLKWPYDIGGSLLKPQRWDVVVFKDPQDGETNFIKRLIGLPGEVLEIIDGDVYTCPISSLSPGLVAELSKTRPPLRSSTDPQYQHLTPEHYRELDQKLTIARKTPVAQESLWLLHYDHDFPPRRDRNLRGGDPTWAPPVFVSRGLNDATPWRTDSPRITFNPIDRAEHTLRLDGHPIQDRYGYDPPMPNHPPEWVNVGDVRLRFLLTPRGNEGHLALTLVKGEDEFRVTIRPDGQITIDRILKDGVPVQKAIKKIEPLEPGRPIEVAVSNLDYRITLTMESRDVLSTTDEHYKPDLARLRRTIDGAASLARVDISARDWPLDMQHVAIDRDVFYRSTRVQTQPNSQNFNAWASLPGWGTSNYPLLLRADNPGDYFCCGDNSPQSKDGRMWVDVAPMLQSRTGAEAYQYGTVPADQMIGRAFFVYWPSGFRVFSSRVGVIPNVGRMRIIR